MAIVGIFIFLDFPLFGVIRERSYIYIYIYISINLSACGKASHVALVRWSSFDERVCGCSAGAWQIRVSRGRICDAKMEAKRFNSNQNAKGIKRVPK